MLVYEKCLSCKYYKSTTLSAAQALSLFGHCVNKKLINYHKRNPYALQENCDKREDNGSVKEARHKSITA